MSSLKSEYRKQDDVVGGDVRNIVTFIGDIVDMTETSNAKTREEDLIDIAQVKAFNFEILPPPSLLVHF